MLVLPLSDEAKPPSPELPAMSLGKYTSSELREPQPVTKLETRPNSRAPPKISRFIRFSVVPVRGTQALTKNRVPHCHGRQASAFLRCVSVRYCAGTPGKQRPVIVLQLAPAAQSTALAQGKAHF
jgi:hypothetical protein